MSVSERTQKQLIIRIVRSDSGSSWLLTTLDRVHVFPAQHQAAGALNLRLTLTLPAVRKSSKI